MLDSPVGARRHELSTRVTETPHDALGLSTDDVLSMYRTMVTARLLDEAAFRQNRMGRAPFVVPVSGHEGCQVGTAWPMRRGIDIWLPYYRDLAVVLAAGTTPYEVFLGIFAKADDPSSGGRQMPAHWGSRRLGIITGSSPIATQVPHAAGIAYAARYRKEDAVVATWFGDGATSEGDWHEGLNFAGVHRLPVIFICENNQYAISVPIEKQMAVKDVASRAEGYGFPGVVVDGNDVLACYAAMKEAHDRARSGGGPTLVECKTYRYFPHTSDDDDKTYRSPDEVEAARQNDPITRFAAYLEDHGVLGPDAKDALHAGVKEEIDAAIVAAWDAPDPEAETALRHVFFEGS
jgi:2-oxoisovalerate dehydrogenase E1 component alpha subunit